MLKRNKERALIVRTQQGDLKALGELYQQYRELVFRTALAATNDAHAAEDILQACFIRLYRYAGSIDAERPLRPWLYRVTLNLVYDWSAQRRWPQPLDEILEWFQGFVAAFPAPDHQVEEKETIQLVHQVIDELSPAQQKVVVLFYLEDISVEEISEILAVPSGTVKSRLYYARKRLRKALLRQQRPVPEVSYEFT
ncbi:MAG TPA: RNA polymerase sigma factor [Thermoflexia bacterium]|nr:RNA polymerase sigma factor [Thermoflexia bacterium]